jgi:hypothetical protein
MTEAKRTVEEGMGLVERFRNGEVSIRSIESALAAIIEERDQAVELAEDYRHKLQWADKSLDEGVRGGQLLRRQHEALTSERDALAARVWELEERHQVNQNSQMTLMAKVGELEKIIQDRKDHDDDEAYRYRTSD